MNTRAEETASRLYREMRKDMFSTACIRFIATALMRWGDEQADRELESDRRLRLTTLEHIQALIRQTRSDALEEAAVLVEFQPQGDRRFLPATIRALKEKG